MRRASRQARAHEAGDVEAGRSPQPIKEKDIDNRGMAAWDERLVNFVCHSVEDGETPGMPDPPRVKTETSPAHDCQETVADCMTGLLDNVIQRPKAGQVGTGLRGQIEDHSHKSQGRCPPPCEAHQWTHAKIVIPGDVNA